MRIENIYCYKPAALIQSHVQCIYAVAYFIGYTQMFYIACLCVIFIYISEINENQLWV